MSQVHRTSCPVLGTLALTALAFAALTVPAQAAAPAASAPHAVSAAPDTAVLPHPPVRPPAPGHGPHDFGWQ
ncbi:hypothetical protein [Streptomyces sp. NRRL WC-3549]|uniref:hypothetical protein n=1 Tax=Streptomyces sp. NRRL WC-3549 TaxID=1463925 RepID=UPI0004C9AD42|nr:hypothetical protein [Streptomyces sp. NRRL WC-3549]